MDDRKISNIFEIDNLITLDNLNDQNEDNIIKHLQTRKNDKFSLLNINIRSIAKNFDNLKSMLHELKFSFQIICVTETWC